jgi:tRNA A-37 threonylcarbamoyl transferase component Bud32
MPVERPAARPGCKLLVNPRYRALLGRCGLHTPADFLALPAVVVSGHPDRHVARVTLGGGPRVVSAYLKREHRVPWKDRLANAWAGFGLVSKSVREAQLLQALGEAGIGCPEWVAVGEDGRGRAFLLLRELTGAVELREYLREHQPRDPRSRGAFARKVGRELARLHARGFEHLDLYAKHVLVDPATQEVFFLDWQRSRLPHDLGRRQRWRDLAALHATLADDLATPRERMTCLRTYLAYARRTPPEYSVLSTEYSEPGTRAAHTPDPLADLRAAVHGIVRRAGRLLHRRHVRETRAAPLRTDAQTLLWLDGDALCVTTQFWSELRGRLPDWLLEASRPGTGGGGQTVVSLPGERQASLVRRSRCEPWRRLWARVRRRTVLAPEVWQAGMLFRLQRHGVPTLRLLAMGQRHVSPWRTDSFLLTERPLNTVDLLTWLASHDGVPRRAVIRQAAVLLRRLHGAGFYLRAGSGCPFDVQGGAEPVVLLGRLEDVVKRRRPSAAARRRDLSAFLAWTAGGRLDLLSRLRLSGIT